jgi:hypothetical protein
MITLSSSTETAIAQVFRVERAREGQRAWSVVQSGSPVATFADRDAAIEAAHTLASNTWRLRQCASRVVVLGEDGRPQAFRMYGDPSQSGRAAAGEESIVLGDGPAPFARAG